MAPKNGRPWFPENLKISGTEVSVTDCNACFYAGVITEPSFRNYVNPLLKLAQGLFSICFPYSTCRPGPRAGGSLFVESNTRCLFQGHFLRFRWPNIL
jgi:hypothetical protein